MPSDLPAESQDEAMNSLANMPNDHRPQRSIDLAECNQSYFNIGLEQLHKDTLSTPIVNAHYSKKKTTQTHFSIDHKTPSSNPTNHRPKAL